VHAKHDRQIGACAILGTRFALKTVITDSGGDGGEHIGGQDAAEDGHKNDSG